MTKRVLLTGGTGFVGRHAVRHLLERGFEVHLAARSPGSPRDVTVTVHRTDLLAAGETRRLLAVVRPTHLLHFAWYAAHGKFWTAEENLAWLSATVELVRAFEQAGGKRIVMAGSCAEYDWTQSAPLNEAVSPMRPASLYGACKLGAQLTAQALARQVGLSFAWGRIFYTYGPHEPPTRLLPSVVLALLRGEEARCTHGRQLRDFLAVDEVAAAFAALLDSSVEGPVNIASGQATSIASIVTRIAIEIGRPELVRMGVLSPPPGDPDVLVADVTRLRREVGFAPSRDFETSLSFTIDWWREELRAGLRGT